MKRNTMKLLSLALALIMLLGTVPFAAAAEATIQAYPGAVIWEGESIDLRLAAPSGSSLTSVKWLHNNSNSSTITVAPTSDITYSVEYQLSGETTKKTAALPVEVLQKAETTFAIKETAAIVGEELQLTVTGQGDSAVEWSGEGIVNSNGKFKAESAGDYRVTATALNDPDDSRDNVSVNATIVASVATYRATMSDKTISLGDKDEKMTYTATKGSETATPTSVVYSIVTGSTYLDIDSSSGLLTPKAAGTATVRVDLTFADNETAYDTASVTVTDSGVITMDQDGKVTDDDEIELDFSVKGPGKNTEVEWTFEVSAVNIKNSTDKSSPYFTWADSKKTDKRTYEVEEDGPEIEVELLAKKGYGVAKISASANWTGGSGADAEGTFYISFYDELDYEVTLKDTVDEFDWDQSDVFSAVKVGSSTYTATQLKTANLADLLYLEAGTYIDFDEGKDADDNEDVGTIEGKKKGDYDPDKVNTFEMEDLEDLTFEAEDEGTYYIDYVQYEIIYNKKMKIGEGVIEINVGKGDGKAKEGDINYDVKNKDEVTLDEDDFEEYWEDYCDDEDINKDFGYVIFDGYKASSIYGALYAEDGDKTMKNSYKFHFDYDDDKDSGYDLNEILYTASSTKTNYIDEIDFTCYSEDGKEEVEGTVSFTVGTVTDDDEKETTVGTMAFTDVKSTDWYYEAVKYVYEQAIMTGTTTTKFSPDTNLNRGMIVTMLYRVEGSPSVTATNKFTDVKSTDWYYDAVRWAAQNGIVNGTTATTFAPTANITRQDLATILYRYVKNYKNQTATTGALTGFADASTVATYATDAMKWAVGQGIINGINGNLQPYGNATRAQAATMFQRLLDK